MDRLVATIKKMSKLQLLIVGLVALCVLIVVVVLVNGARSGSDESRNVVATVSGKKITKADLDQRVGRKYEASYINDEVSTIELELMIEEYLLDEEAKSRSLSSETPKGRNYYGELRRKLFPDSVSHVEAYTIAYNASSATDAVKATLISQHEQAFARALGELELGGDPLVISKKLVDDYSLFQDFLTINEMKYTDVERDGVIPPFQLIGSTSTIEGITINEVLNLRENEVKVTFATTPPSAYAVRVLRVELANTYQEWLAQKKISSVVLPSNN